MKFPKIRKRAVAFLNRRGRVAPEVMSLICAASQNTDETPFVSWIEYDRVAMESLRVLVSSPEMDRTPTGRAVQAWFRRAGFSW